MCVNIDNGPLRLVRMLPSAKTKRKLHRVFEAINCYQIFHQKSDTILQFDNKLKALRLPHGRHTLFHCKCYPSILLPTTHSTRYSADIYFFFIDENHLEAKTPCRKAKYRMMRQGERYKDSLKQHCHIFSLTPFYRVIKFHRMATFMDFLICFCGPFSEC